MYIVSISDLLHWLTCPRAAVNRIREGRWSPSTQAMSFGTWFHQEMHYALWPMATLPNAPRPPRPIRPDIKEDFDACQYAIDNFRPDYTIIDLERPYYMDISPGLRLVGRLDGVASTGGSFLSIQHKSLGVGRSLALEFERVRLSYHEISYAALAHAHELDLAGTIVNVWTKLRPSRSRRPAGVPTHDVVPAGLLSATLWRSSAESTQLFRDYIQPRLRAFAADLGRPAAALPDFRSCYGPFGSGPLCPIYGHCHGPGSPNPGECVATLPAFVSTAARYPEFPEPGDTR